MEPVDLLCSRNARPQKALVGRAQWEINQPPSLKRKGWNDTRADPLLPERARSECARSTAAVGPTRVPFQGEKQASLEGPLNEGLLYRSPAGLVA